MAEELRVSLKQVAAVAGVSIATASQALRRVGGTSTATAARIKAVADRLGYRPHPTLAALASARFRASSARRAEPVGVFMLRPNGAGGLLRLKTALHRDLQDLGYRAVIEVVASAERIPGRVRHWRHKGMRGALLLPVDDSRWDQSFPAEELAVVFCGGRFHHPCFDTVKTDVSRSVRDAFSRARARGARRVGLAPMRVGPGQLDDWLRRGAALACVDELPEAERIPPCCLPLDDGRGFVAWYRKHRPDLLIGFNQLLCWHLESAGLPRPGRDEFINLHAELGSPYPGPAEPFEEIARKAVELLDWKIRFSVVGKPESPVVLLVPPAWREG